MPRWIPRRLPIIVLLGLGIGVASSIADRLPVDSPLIVLVALGNALGPWLAVAFAGGALQDGPRPGALAGTLTLAAGVIAYYVAAVMTWGTGVPSSIGALVVTWTAAALVAGPIFGAAGGIWRAGGRGQVLGASVIAGALLAEAIAKFIEVEGWTGIDLSRTALQVCAVEVVAAAILPFRLGPRDRLRSTYASTIGVAIAGAFLMGAAAIALRR